MSIAKLDDVTAAKRAFNAFEQGEIADVLLWGREAIVRELG
jgi:hypothetical protein